MYRTVGFVSAVLTETVHQVPGRSMGDGHERAQIHQQAAVAVEHHHSPVMPSQGDAQGMRGALPHGASKRVVQVTGTDVEPFLRRLVDGHDNFIRPVTS